MRYVFDARNTNDVLGVICDFIEGEARNLKQGVGIIEEIKNPSSAGFDGVFFKTRYDSRDGSRVSLEDMPTKEMAEAVRVEYQQDLKDSIFP